MTSSRPHVIRRWFIYIRTSLALIDYISFDTITAQLVDTSSSRRHLPYFVGDHVVAISYTAAVTAHFARGARSAGELDRLPCCRIHLLVCPASAGTACIDIAAAWVRVAAYDVDATAYSAYHLHRIHSCLRRAMYLLQAR